jgi:hypothetical protein
MILACPHPCHDWPGKGGWLVKSEGKWTLTDDGKAALKEYSDPEQFMKRSAQLYRKWKASQPNSDELQEDEGGESVRTTLEEALSNEPVHS